MSAYDDHDLDDRVYEEAANSPHEDVDLAVESPRGEESGQDKPQQSSESRPKRPRFELPADKFERKRSPKFLLTHNPDLDMGCDCLQLVQAYGTNRTKWKPKWNIEQKDEKYRADLDVCIRDSSDVVLVRGHWCDNERAAKRSAAQEGCKRLIEKGEKRNLMRLAEMIGAWVFVQKYGDGSDRELADKIVSEAKEILETGDFKRGGERGGDKAADGQDDNRDSDKQSGEHDNSKQLTRRNALDIVDNVFDQVWGEKKFIRRQPIYEVVDLKHDNKKDANAFRVVVTIPKLVGTFDEDTVVTGTNGDTILDARRNVAWQIGVMLHERGKLPNHVINEHGTSAPAVKKDKRQQSATRSVGYSDRDRERDRERERRDGDRDSKRDDRDRDRDRRDDRRSTRGSSPSRFDDADVRSERRRSRSRSRTPPKRKDRDDDYSNDPKRRKRD